MRRKIYDDLLKWKNSSDRMPLLLNGARQVGKTYILLTFGEEQYANYVYLNFEEAKELANIFARNLEPERIVRELSVYTSKTIMPENTLIIFDEIQACEEALTSLKYFCEMAPQYHIVAAGSLLGVAVKREKYSFPVGKVKLLTMYPLDFEEFLWATGKAELSNHIREGYTSMQAISLHEEALDEYKKYLVVGGMPRVVAEFANKNNYDFVLATQRDLNNSYIADMAKYADEFETTRIMAVWRSIPAQLAKENKKFQYKLIKSGARANVYETPLDWLVTSGIIYKCVRTNEGKMPLSVYADNSAFKVYMVDTGLLCSKFGIAASVVVSGSHSLDGFKGALAENYIMQALITNGFEPYYWGKDNILEVDFLFQNKMGEIIPIECKSAEHVRARSLKKYMEIYKPPYAIRVSGRNFGYENNIKSIPLYAMFCLKPEEC